MGGVGVFEDFAHVETQREFVIATGVVQVGFVVPLYESGFTALSARYIGGEVAEMQLTSGSESLAGLVVEGLQESCDVHRPI